jgi:hypothetical protein
MLNVSLIIKSDESNNYFSKIISSSISHSFSYAAKYNVEIEYYTVYILLPLFVKYKQLLKFCMTFLSNQNEFR